MGAIIAARLASFLYKPLDMVWTGFVRADAFNPRYAFLLHFALTLCASFAIDSAQIRRVRSTRVDEDGAVNENTGATGPVPAAGPAPTAAAPAPRPRVPRIALAAFGKTAPWPAACSILRAGPGFGRRARLQFELSSMATRITWPRLEDAANQLKIYESQDGSPCPYRHRHGLGRRRAMIPIPYQGTANEPDAKDDDHRTGHVSGNLKPRALQLHRKRPHQAAAGSPGLLHPARAPGASPPTKTPSL